jgi:glutathione S-transferase
LEDGMLKVHHLNNSRSQRILWLLEELGTPYEIVHYKRMEGLPLAPPELKAVHPLGKSPVITDDGVTVAESGAIIEYLLDKYGNGHMRPAPGTADHVGYVQWLHYAEGSAMTPLLLALYAGMLGDGAAPLRPYIEMEIAKHLSYIEGALEGREFLIGEHLTGADVQISFVLEAAAAGDRLKDHPALTRYLDRLHARPAYLRALEKGGPYQLMAR